MAKRLRVEIHGAVQGVGFRPYVYRLATELALTGWVINDTRGVFIEVEGDEATLARFLERLPREKPPRAIIHSLEVAWIDPNGDTHFEIRHSDDAGAKTVLVLPDIATCADCLREVFDVRNRRAGYPFTNCTNCGPRFSIIEALPYDRPNTTMRHFAMCPACQREYENPLDRRFHAQPNACPVCGPRVWLVPSPKFDVQGSNFKVDNLKPRTSNFEPQTSNFEPPTLNLEPITHAARLLAEGYIVAVKGLGGFLLMADARNAETLARLRARKPRRDKPFALMTRDLAQARTLVETDAQAEALLTSPEAPIVLLHRKPDAPVAENVAPGNPYLGVMLPYTPLHHLLLRAVDFPVVATSGNLSDEPICTDENEAVERLGDIAEFFLVHNRPIARHVDDSVMTIMCGEPRLMRRARGYAPLPVLLAREIPTILAVGAHLKNTIALSVRNQVFISQHIGDLETPEAMHAFERVIADFLKLYEATPVAIAHDLHPEYLSTKWAHETNDERRRTNDASFVLRPSSLVAVQHHHAHLAACLAENHAEHALGVTWDGTGYGTDGTIWGGEFLLGDTKDFQRVAHLRPFRLPGGDAAIKEPRRTAFALLYEMFGEAIIERDDLAPIRAFTRAERRTLAQMLARNLNAPITTSAGRLFDGVAALVGLHQQVSFEGQAAMALEYAAEMGVEDAYPLGVTKDERRTTKDERRKTNDQSSVLRPLSFVLDWQPLLVAVLADLARGVERGMIAARFHNALVEAIVAIAREIGEENVALSGGCFQNRFLTERAATQLAQAGFRVLLHRHVPPNDGCISLGQVVVAAARIGEQ